MNIQIIKHTMRVWIKITIKIITGFEEIKIRILRVIDKDIKGKITEFSLFKILTLEVKDNF